MVGVRQRPGPAGRSAHVSLQDPAHRSPGGAQDTLKGTQPHCSGERQERCPCLPWHLQAWGLSTGQAFLTQRCAPLKKEPEIQLYKYQCRR